MRPGRLLPWLVGAVALVGALVVAAGGDAGPRSDEARVEALADELRCPTCQGLSVAASPSSTARAIRDDIARRVDEGQTDDQIKAAYVDRYGDWILLRPKGSGVATLVWALPVAVVVLAAGGLALTFRRWRREPAMVATEADEALVSEARDDRNLRDEGSS